MDERCIIQAFTNLCFCQKGPKGKMLQILNSKLIATEYSEQMRKLEAYTV